MAIFNVTGSDGLSLGDSNGSKINPYRVSNVDGFSVSDHPSTSSLRNMMFRGNDSFNLSEFPGSKFPTYFRGSDTIKTRNLAEYLDDTPDVPHDDSEYLEFIFPSNLDHWFRFGTRSFRVQETISVNDSGFMHFGFVSIGNQSDTIFFIDVGTFLLVSGPLSRVVIQTVILSDSYTFTKSKGKTDYILVYDLACHFFQLKRAATQTISLIDFGTFRVKGRLNTPPGTLPGTGGANFRVTLRKTALDRITMLERSQASLNNVVIRDQTCVLLGPINPGWGSWTSWGERDRF